MTRSRTSRSADSINGASAGSSTGFDERFGDGFGATGRGFGDGTLTGSVTASTTSASGIGDTSDDTVAGPESAAVTRSVAASASLLHRFGARVGDATGASP